MMLLQIGFLRMAVLNSDGSKLKTLILPPPSQDGLDLEWDEDSSTVKLAEGGRRTRRIGYVPVLTCKWKIYDDRPGLGQTIGTDNGQCPSLEQLLVLLSLPTKSLRVSPGLAAGGFTVDQAVVKPIGKKSDFYTGIQVTFYGRDATATMALEAF